MTTAIEARGLSKRYSGAWAVKDVSFAVEAGCVYGFIGPNGAGKTSTISLLTGLLPPTEGDALIFGRSVRKEPDLKRRIGVVPDSPRLYGYMSAKEYLEFFSGIYGVKDNSRRIRELLDYFSLSEHAKKKLKKYSHGMKQKVNIARALVHDPEVLFLDEPISGLDPSGVKEVRDVIISEKNKGKTIFISSHILSEMDKVCDHVGIINRGRMLSSGSVEEVIGAIDAGIEHVIEVDCLDDALPSALREIRGVSAVSAEGKVLRITAKGGHDIRRDLSRRITRAGAVILAMREEGAGLEDAFVEMIKEEGR